MSDNTLFLQTQKFTLKAGVSLSATSIELSSFNLPDGTAITSSDIGAINYMTLEPGTSNEEQITFTGLTSTTLTGVTRGVSFNTPYDEDTSLAKAHAAGAIAVITNTAAFYDSFVNKNNDETMVGQLKGPEPLSNTDYATKNYVDVNVNGGAVSIDQVVVAATAGETVAAGELVYFDDTDNEWKLTDADTATTVESVLLAIAQGAGTDGGAISGGVLVKGVDANQSGLTIGVKLYASNTPGAIAESAGTTERVIGFSKSATEVYFDPYFNFHITDTQQSFLGSVTGMIIMYGAATPTGFLDCDGSAVSRTTFADLFTAISTTYGVGDGSTTFNVPDLTSSVPVGAGQKTNLFDFVDGDVTVGTDQIVVDSNDFLHTGQLVTLTTTGTLPTGLATSTNYFIIRVSDTVIQLATSIANANAGTVIDITAAAGGGTHTVNQVLTSRSLADTGGEETHALTDAELPSHTHDTTGASADGAGSPTFFEYQSFGSGTTLPTQSTGSDDVQNNMPPYLGVRFIIKT